MSKGNFIQVTKDIVNQCIENFARHMDVEMNFHLWTQTHIDNYLSKYPEDRGFIANLIRQHTTLGRTLQGEE